MQKPLLILDLDETLLHATRKAVEGVEADAQWAGYNIYLRPHLNSFFQGLLPYYQFAIWSSGSDDYVKVAVRKLLSIKIPFLFIWGRSKCTYRRSSYFTDDFYYSNEGFYDPYKDYEYYKILKKVKKAYQIPLERMLIVDNTPEKLKFNYGNAIYIKDFEGDPKDEELNKLSQYLFKIKDHKNYRSFEKRFWKEHL
jgi:RNA polymerase II subunit A small phosphatase-like protein